MRNVRTYSEYFGVYTNLDRREDINDFIVTSSGLRHADDTDEETSANLAESIEAYGTRLLAALEGADMLALAGERNKLFAAIMALPLDVRADAAEPFMQLLDDSWLEQLGVEISLEGDEQDGDDGGFMTILIIAAAALVAVIGVVCVIFAKKKAKSK
jgi:hypothetical protein